MNSCKHKPLNTSLLRYSSGRGPYVASSGETCRYCDKPIRMQHPALAKGIFVVLVLCFVFHVGILLLLRRIFPGDGALWYLISGLLLAAPILYLVFGGWLFSWEIDNTGLHRTTMDPDQVDVTVRSFDQEIR